jgi:hypothetical protein
MPYLPISHPSPPPSVRPAIPRADDATSGREAIDLRLAVELTPGDATLCSRRSRRRVNHHGFHQREVNHHAIVADGSAGHVMPATANCDLKFVRPGEFHRVLHISHA